MNIKSLILYLLFCASIITIKAQGPLITPEARIHPVSSENGMVVSQDEIATDAALQVLKRGGNAADAAVTLAYTLAVTQPKAGNIGGGGFALYYEAKSGRTYALDFRETAPADAHEKMYLDRQGNVIKNESRFHLKASGVPGTVHGLKTLLTKFGTKKHRELIAPAVSYAQNGFPVSAGLAYDLRTMEKALKEYPQAAAIFYPGGRPLKQGETLKQPALARTLMTLAVNGPDDFYTGKTAALFAAYFRRNRGLITAADLKNYRTKTYEPVSGTYRGYKIAAMPPPSSGGVHIIQMLNILERWNLNGSGAGSASTVHLLAESMKLAYADRSKHLGDPAYSKIPVNGLTSKKYADALRQKINTSKTTPSKEILPGKPAVYESPDTTHFSIADKFGNVISFTYTINFSFGSRRIIPDLGFFLNNEMDDFSSKPGVPNAYGLIGGSANKIEPGKRPLSSMTPLIVLKNGKPFLVTGSPGGSKIITALLQTVVNVIDHKMNLAEAAMAPRIHHQWLPDKLILEKGFSPDTIQLLHLMGHKIEGGSSMGCVESILIDKGFFYGFADPRRMDGKANGH